MFLGIEIGGTKLQMGLGDGNGSLAGSWRGEVDVAAGPEGIRRQITTALPELLEHSRIPRSSLRAAGIGFGGPVDDITQTVIKSHQIAGWDNFPLADWVGKVVGLPCALGNDADVAGLAEALFGAGKGLSPLFYITIGSGIGGSLILKGEIYRGLRPRCRRDRSSGVSTKTPGCASPRGARSFRLGHPGAGRAAARLEPSRATRLLHLAGGDSSQITAKHVAEAAKEADPLADELLAHAREALADAICDMIALLCPRRIVIGGGVSLMGDELFFQPLRELVAARVFAPFAACYDIVAAALGETVVVHGALALAQKNCKLTVHKPAH